MTNRLFEPASPVEQEQVQQAGTIDNLQQKARQVATAHKLGAGSPRTEALFLKRLSGQDRQLRAAYRRFRQRSNTKLTFSYAAEWMLDNFYVVQQALRQIQEDLPVGYYRRLPKLDSLSGLPRIYALAHELVLYEQAQLDMARVEQFVHAYQTITPLTMGEVWALPIMLRFAILESLTQAASRLTGQTKTLETPIPALQFNYEVADPDIVAHCIPSLRLLASQDWKLFFEDVSLVEQMLRGDPARIYPRMDFDTRNHYRTVIEELAKATNQAEVEIVQAAVNLAAAHVDRGARPGEQPDVIPVEEEDWAGLDLPRQTHLGFYLIDAGLAHLETRFNYHPAGWQWLRRVILAHPTLFYLGSIGLGSLFILAAAISYALGTGGDPPQIAVSVLITLIPAITIAVYLINWLATTLLPPRILPKLDFEEGIPERCRTMVVIPALLTHPAEVESLISQLELHYLRNPDPHLTFALLTDFADAPQEQMPEDEDLIAQARQSLEAHNRRYDFQPFYLFHRRRLWNPGEETWMGWERKRGKLHEFNLLLRGSPNTSFFVQAGDLSVLPAIRYVITLDADTVLPRDSARQLVSTLSHPLNRAQFDPATGQVTAGYTVLQPRTEIKPTSANQSLFTRVFAGDTGLDLYTLAVSDVYQDLFGEGIYVGKGIYDVDTFEASLSGRVPENALLSHDLFEGIHGRAGLVTDIILYEDYPPHYLVHIHRSHRWVRGDWQLLPWLGPRRPQAGKGIITSALSVIDRWKIIDNLRRSLLPPALLLLFLAGWLWLPGSAFVWTVLGLLTPAWPLLTTLINSGMRLIGGGLWSEIRRSLGDSALRFLLAIAFLPYESVLALDAIATTLVRLFITRRQMLQWTTAAHSVHLFGQEVKSSFTWRQMISAVLVSGLLTVLILLFNPAALPAAAPLLLVWLLSPEIAYWISRPAKTQPDPLSEMQRQQLRTLARRTWLFFEQFVGPQDNWLPPDHFQESPRGVVAHRTSPTNVGLYLLTTLGAYDLGYLDALELALRLRATFDTLKQLERYRGHFLNWIDTQSLHSLPPRYVSTVDSGNLAACFLILRQGCLSIARHPLWRWVRWQGFLDALDLLNELVTELDATEPNTSATAIQTQITTIRQQVLAARDKPGRWAALLSLILAESLPQLDQLLIAWIEDDVSELDPTRLRNVRRYAERLHHDLEGIERQLQLLPWLLPLTRPPELFDQPELDPAIAVAWQALLEILPTGVVPALNEIEPIYQQAQAQLGILQKILSGQSERIQAAHAWCEELATRLQSAELRVKTLQLEYEQLSYEAETYLEEMDFAFLFNHLRQVFHIGYNLDAGRLDDNYYDLLASEARIASLVAIAKNEIPQSHWLHLGRPLRRLTEGQALLSWSGTMFEYLMPSLLMRTYEGTLLHQSVQAAVAYQIAYGQQKDVPWGISESGYYAFDANQNYQYRAFGAPALGFKRGLADDLVITPYASLLALPLQPQAVLENIARLTRLKMLGRYGLYEALDYTPTRLSLGAERAVVASYMAHHQGMIMLALVNFLHDEIMLRRFHSEPRLQSVELLLQERIPEQAPDEKLAEADVPALGPGPMVAPIAPWAAPVDAPQPQVHYLSNGHYHLLLTSAGGGYSRWREISLTRWRADTTRDNWGSWLYLQDEDYGTLWSAGYQPTRSLPESQSVVFHPHMAEFRRSDDEIALTMTVTVAPDDDVEIRLVTLTNNSDQRRRLRLTSYGEVVLAAQSADERHPAFAKLFVQSEYVPEPNALLFRRRPRSAHEDRIYLAHLLLLEPDQPPTLAYESSRPHFLGRGHTLAAPAALSDSTWLSGASGATLDPIFALGQTIELAPDTSTRLAFLTLVASSHQAALELAGRYRQWTVIERTFTQARSRSEYELRRLSFDSDLFKHAQQLLGLLLYPHPARRAEPATLAANQKGQPGLWAFGISGDYPILLVFIQSDEELPLAQELLQLHTYWRHRHLKIDLVFLNRQEASYGQVLQGDLFRLIQRAGSDTQLNQRGGIFLLLQQQISETDLILLQTAARVVLYGERGSLASQLAGLYEYPTRLPEHTPVLSPTEAVEPTPPLPRPDNLQFDNGWGGFSPDGREYIIYLRPDEPLPAPWINVIANETFGFLVSETGSAYTWAVNSGENRLTPWRNDPIADTPGEVLYLRDEETAEVWSPTPQPAPAPEPYLVRHGPGYTVFEHHSHGLRQHLRMFAAPDAPLKIVQLRLQNDTTRSRRITATYYLEWVLEVNRETSQPYIITEYDEDSRALLARNPYNVEFGQRVAFVAANKPPHGLTTDRAEFLGRMGTLALPAGLWRMGLEGRVGAGFDPCAALQLHLDLAPGGVEEIYFFMGQGADREETRSVIRRYQDPNQVAAAWQAVQTQWADILGTIQVDTPDPAMNLLLNGWLLYQTLACRVWGRSALYQSSGAYGFRDQLQDVLALLHTRPNLAREQILRAARHQFIEGDVLHWWHPPSGRGVRTLIRDDLLWLPYVTAQYVTVTDDESILQEQIPFLKGEILKEEEEERYGHYESSQEVYNLFEHCRRALKRGDTKGRHSLPLMGGGDWNDGMNRVGSEGKGESVWLGWFLYTTLLNFAQLCQRLEDADQAAPYRQRAEELRRALEAQAWDGAWYRRAYYDDGTPLGSRQNRECQIDAIAQSWAVLSQAAPAERAGQAMAAVMERLVKWDERLILLFTPPFNKTPHDPGYIKGYLPGIRENGGQYTHAAMWTIWAMAQLGDGDQAEALFRLINPIYRADTREKVKRYQVEPYVISADVYSVPPHTGRGGWTWYTGSSGWMYRLGLEAILGLRREGTTLWLDPCIPRTWPGFCLTYRYGETIYEIQVENTAGVKGGVKQICLDGQNLADGKIPLVADGRHHQVEIKL